MSANFDRFQIGDPMDDQHFVCAPDERETAKDEDPKPFESQEAREARLWREWKCLPDSQRRAVANNCFCYACGLLRGQKPLFWEKLEREIREAKL